MHDRWRSGSRGSIASGAGGSRWRADQRRRRRLSQRGRLTLAALCALSLAGLAGWAARGSSASASAPRPERGEELAAPLEPARPPARSRGPLDSRGLAPVASGPKRSAAPATPGQSLLERLPATRSVLALPTFVPELEYDAFGLVSPVSSPRFYEELAGVPGADSAPPGPLRVEYTLDAELTRQIFAALERGRVSLGHVIVMDPRSGRVLAYASTDAHRFPATRTYPAASLVKVVTAAAALSRVPERSRGLCRFNGSPYRLTPSRIDPPRGRATEISLAKALATSNNQCFAQLAVHGIGQDSLVDALGRFGWTQPPAPGHPGGVVKPVETRFQLGELGCGLDGCAITPLHAAQMAGILARGQRVTPHWIERVVDGQGRVVAAPPSSEPVQVLRPELARELRQMLVDTTVRGTARSAFRRHAPKLSGKIKVAGKTGSLSGTDPKGHYEWFAGVAPADDPKIAIATVVVNGELWWRSASQLAAEVLELTFCEGRRCGDESLARWLPAAAAPAPPRAAAAPNADAG